MKAVILTEDSSSQLPSFNKYTKRYGNGFAISKNHPIIDLLKKEKLTLPGDDIENEAIYKKILHEYVRSANDMFGGRYSEVRYFENQLKDLIPTDMLIISGRYGLLKGDTEIIPYDFTIKTEHQLKEFGKKHHLITNLLMNLSGSTHLIILLPKIFIEYLSKHGLFDELPTDLKIICVTSKQLTEPLKKYQNIIILERRGVSRIRNQNCNTILSMIKK